MTEIEQQITHGSRHEEPVLPRSRAPLRGPRSRGAQGVPQPGLSSAGRAGASPTPGPADGGRSARRPVAGLVRAHRAGARRVRHRPVRHRPSVILAGRDIHDRGRQPNAWADPVPAQDRRRRARRLLPVHALRHHAIRPVGDRGPAAVSGRGGGGGRLPRRCRNAARGILRHEVAACIRPARRPVLCRARPR